MRAAALPVLLAVLVLPGCGVATAAVPAQAGTRSVSVTATFGGGTAVTYDPALVPDGARATVRAVTSDGSTTVTLEVEGLLPGRTYGAHAHTQPCGATGAAAGPHFQHVPDPVQPSVDPAYANPANEVWLDLTTDADGNGSASTTVGWQPQARSVVVHAMPTATDQGRAGTAGDRAACVTVPFREGGQSAG